MVEPWFDPNRFGMLVGAIGGGVGGSLLGMLGAAAGMLAPKGRARGPILGAMRAAVAVGLVVLAIGLYALATGQPYGIWYPLVLLGGIASAVVGLNIPAVKAAYRAAEGRRLQAEGFRAGG